MHKYYKLLLSLIVLLGFTSCNNPLNSIMPKKRKQPRHHVIPHIYEAPTAAKRPLFQEAMIKVAKSTLTDSRYNKMILNTPEKKAWFKTLMYRLWDRQITRNEFIAQGLRQYPNKRYEFTFVANGFQKQS